MPNASQIALNGHLGDLADIVKNPDFDFSLANDSAFVQMILKCRVNRPDRKHDLLLLLLDKGVDSRCFTESRSFWEWVNGEEIKFFQAFLDHAHFWPGAFAHVNGSGSGYVEEAEALCSLVSSGRADPHEVNTIGASPMREVIELAQSLHKRRRTYILICVSEHVISDLAHIIMQYDSYGPLPTKQEVTDLQKELQ
jgi:hypothetical protein